MGKYTLTQANAIIQHRKIQTETYTKSRHDKFNEIYGRYRAWQEQPQEVLDGSIPNLVIPYIFSKIETKLPRILQSFFFLNPFFKVKGVGDEDDVQATANQDILEHQIYREMNFLRFLMSWGKQTFLYGTSFAVSLWEKDVAKIKRRFRLSDEEVVKGISSVGDTDFIRYDGHDVRALDVFDCFPAPTGSVINGRKSERIPYFIVREEVSGDYLKSLLDIRDGDSGEALYNSKELTEVLQTDGGGIINRTRSERLGILGVGDYTYLDERIKMFEMYTMWEDDWVVSEIDGHIIRNSPNPLFEQEIPIVMAQDTPVPNELFAIGQAEPLLKFDYHVSDLLNLNLQNLERIINPGYFTSVQSGLDVDAFRENPSGVHPVRGNPALAGAPVQMGQAQALGRVGIFDLIQLGDRSSGSDELIGGQAPRARGDATLGEIERRIQQANVRFNLSSMVFMSSIKELLNKMIKRNSQFLPAEKRIRVHQTDQPKLLQRDDWLGQFDVYIKMAPLQGNKQAWASTLVNFLQVLNRTRGAYPALVERIGEALELDNPREIMEDPARDIMKIILQAQQKGMTKNPAAVQMLLGEILRVSAPPGSANEKEAQAFAKQINLNTEEGNEKPAR